MDINLDNILLGNILAFIGTSFMVISGYIKDNKRFFIIQDLELFFLTISNLVLGGYTGALVSAFGIIRNTLCYKNKLNKKMRIIIVVIQTVACLIANNLGVIGLFPLFAVILYTLFITTDSKKLKIINATTLVFWAIYDFYIKAYTAGIFDILTIITCLIGLYRLNKDKILKSKNNI
jgi:hypothetical protein